MSRIDIEGAIPVRASIANDPKQGDQRDRERFAGYLQPQLSHKLVATKAAQHGLASPDQWADYRIVSGVLNGTQVRVTLTASGWVLQLRCSNSKTKRLLSRFKARWQRALTRLGVPCSLEVVDAVESIP